MKIEAGLDELNSVVKHLPKSGIILLKGDLASGKTTLTKAIIDSLGARSGDGVSSPSFGIMHDYGGVYHYDIYRCGVEAIVQNGVFENLFEEGLHIVEWGGEELLRLLRAYGLEAVVVDIAVLGERRIYEIL